MRLTLREDAAKRIEILIKRANRDRETLDFPHRKWVPPHTTPEGNPVLNVLVVGAGQSGISVLAALMRQHVDGVLGIDSTDEGREGPWLNFARMNTLRTPKELTGPDLGLSSLTFREWYEAHNETGAWDSLDRIPRLLWAEYLTFVRAAFGLPIRNNVRLLRIRPHGRYLAADIATEHRNETLIARKIVLATGVDGGGEWHVPENIRALPRALWAHSSDDIDFAKLSGRSIAVIGAAASATDNAATALEHGASYAEQFCRRRNLQLIQPMKWMGFSGFLRCFADMDDEWRWRFMSYALDLREPITEDAIVRVSRFTNYRLSFCESCDDVACEGGKIRIGTQAGHKYFDYLICGTGVSVDSELRPELAEVADQFATWGDRYDPPLEEKNGRLARFPYLTNGFAFMPRTPGDPACIGNIHCLNFAATLSMGPSGAAIRPLKYVVPRLVNALTLDLFRDDVGHHWSSFRAFTEGECNPALFDHLKQHLEA